MDRNALQSSGPAEDVDAIFTLVEAGSNEGTGPDDETPAEEVADHLQKFAPPELKGKQRATWSSGVLGRSVAAGSTTGAATWVVSAQIAWLPSPWTALVAAVLAIAVVNIRATPKE